MLVLRLVKKTEDLIVYNYYPEDKEYFGTIQLNLETDEYSMIKKAENDFGDYYLVKAYQGLRKMKKEDQFLKMRTVAWY